RAAGDRAGFRPDTFAPFLERLPRLIDPHQRITYAELLGHGLGPIVSRFIAQRDGMYRSVTYLYPSTSVNLDALDAAVRRADAHLRLTALPVVEQELARRFGPEFVKGLAAGIVAIVVLMYAIFRAWRPTVLAL